jgi:hypothetical protein
LGSCGRCRISRCVATVALAQQVATAHKRGGGVPCTCSAPFQRESFT